MTDDAPTFEQAELELRRIVERLETGEASVDEALALWERGENLYTICREQLDAAEGKVEELAQRVQASKRSA
jgi:exodeoxyribonuclease VII small subunit